MTRAASLSLLAAVLTLACGERTASTLRDDLGRPIDAPRNIARIVSLAPSVTEMLFAIGAGDRVVGVDDFSNYPAAAKKITRVGGMQPNVEKIAALKPDIVFASTEGNHPSLAPALAAAKIPLYVVKADRLQEVTLAMTRLGDLLDARGTERALSELVAAIDSNKRRRPAQARVLFAVWTDPLYVAGKGTFTDDLYTLTDAQNAVHVRGWPQYSLESLAARPPDLILFPKGAVTREQVDAMLKRVPGVKATVIAVDEDIFQRPGPRLGQAAKALNAILDQWNAER